MTSAATRRTLIGAAIAVVAIVGVFALTHAVAWASYRSSFDARPVDARLASARLASRLEPFDDTYRIRAQWLLGSSQLSAGDYNAAVETLAQAYRADTGNAELLVEFKEAQRIQSIETVKKAHLQHGHEGEGGTLAPEDIER